MWWHHHAWWLVAEFLYVLILTFFFASVSNMFTINRYYPQNKALWELSVQEGKMVLKLKSLRISPDGCGSVNQVLVCESKGHQFNFQPGHMPELWARSEVGVPWEASTHWCSPLPYPSPLSKKKKNLKKKKVWESLHYSVNSLGVRRSPPDRYYKPVLKKYLWNEHQFIQEGIHKAVKKFWKGFPWPADIKHCLWNEWLNKKFKCIQSLKISNGKFVLVTEFIVALLALYFFFH